MRSPKLLQILAQILKKQNSPKIVKSVSNPNMNIKQYEQSIDTHFVNATEEAKAKIIPLY